MKAMFSPSVDSIEEAVHFVEYCYERGLDISVETVGTPKRRRRRPKREPRENISKPLDKDEDSDNKKIASQANGEGKDVSYFTPRKKPGRAKRKKRSPKLDRLAFNQIKGGNKELESQYSKATVQRLKAFGSWDVYSAWKAAEARRARVRRHAKGARKKAVKK